MSKNLTFQRTQFMSEFRLPGRNGRVVGHNGEINASDKRELAMTIAALLQESAGGTQFQTEEAAVKHEELAKKHRELVSAAFSDPVRHRELGAELALEIYISANKEGFMRRLCNRQDVVQGQFPQIQMRMKNVYAVAMGSASSIELQYIRDNWFFPQEFYVQARPYIEKRDIDRSNTDILEQKYIEGLEAIMVQEDRYWYNLAKATIGQANDSTAIVGTLNPAGLTAIRSLVTRWQIPTGTCLIASDIWNDIVSDTGFQNIIDPVSKHELLLTGYLGQILGMGILTDGFRHPTHHVLNQGDIFAVGQPIYHGAYTDRGGIESLPIDAAITGIPGRGWQMDESLSLVVANVRSVAYGNRT